MTRLDLPTGISCGAPTSSFEPGAGSFGIGPVRSDRKTGERSGPVPWPVPVEHAASNPCEAAPQLPPGSQKPR
jgi:hypothetical protein